MTGRDDIRDRIDVALEKMRAQGVEVRAIYLTEADRKALGRAIKAEWGFNGTVHPCGYRDHIVRDGKHSLIYSKQGVGFTIPKRLSHRTVAPESEAA